MNNSDKTLDYLKNVESNARTYANDFNIVINSGYNANITDVNQKSYIDFLGGAGTLALGHNNEHVIKAMQDFLEEGHILHGLDLATPIKEEFVKTLFSMLPEEFTKDAKIQFCGPTGTDAVEAAIKLLKISTGRSSIIAFHGSYHGMAHGSLSMTGNLSAKSKIQGLIPEVHFMPYPYLYRRPFGKTDENTVERMLDYIRNALKDPNSGIKKPAAMIIEVVQGEGGSIPAPVEFIQGIRKITSELDIPLIIDEVQTGLGRTGHMFAFEEANIIPDAIVVSKAIGGGLPISAVIYNKKYDKWKSGSHAGTFRGNQLAMVAGVATMNYIKNEDILSQVRNKGKLIMEFLEELKNNCKIIGDVRGKGLMIGVELIDPTKEPDDIGLYPNSAEITCEVKTLCFKRGLIVESGGRYDSVLRLLPPLTTEVSTIEKALSILKESLMDVNKKVLEGKFIFI